MLKNANFNFDIIGSSTTVYLHTVTIVPFQKKGTTFSRRYSTEKQPINNEIQTTIYIINW